MALGVMQPFIRVLGSWEDEDILQLEIEVCDGSSTVLIAAYEWLDWFATAADGLERFGKQIYGGLFDLEAGNFGPEYARGALAARFHWFKPNRLLIAARLQSDFFEFKGNLVASEAQLFLRTEPALLDRFIDDLRAVHKKQQAEARLACIPLDDA